MSTFRASFVAFCSLSVCVSSQSGVIVQFDGDTDKRRVVRSLDAGSILTVKLKDVHSTGFEWFEMSKDMGSPKSALKLLGTNATSPHGKGAPSWRFFYYAAIAATNAPSEIVLEYVRPWERSNPTAMRTFANVTVEKVEHRDKIELPKLNRLHPKNCSDQDTCNIYFEEFSPTCQCGHCDGGVDPDNYGVCFCNVKRCDKTPMWGKSGTIVQFDGDNNQRRVVKSLDAGSVLTVKVKDVHSTGFEWLEVSKDMGSPRSALKLLDTNSTPAHGKGAPSWRFFYYLATAATGAPSEIVLEHVRPWERSNPTAMRTFANVTVEKVEHPRAVFVV